MNGGMRGAFGAIVCAAGSSSRMGGIKKEFQILPETADSPRALTVLGAAVSAFASIPAIGIILITIPAGMEEAAESSLPPDRGKLPPICFVSGGKSRRESVHSALQALSSYMPDYALIHDGARPWLDSALIERLCAAMLLHGAVIPILPLVETPKEIDSTGLIIRHLQRNRLGTAQTPQGFPFPAILEAHNKAALREQEGQEYTDDAEVWGEFVGPVMTIPGSLENRKITYPADLQGDANHPRPYHSGTPDGNSMQGGGAP